MIMLYRNIGLKLKCTDNNFNKINLNNSDTKKFINGVKVDNEESKKLGRSNLNRIYNDQGTFLGIGETKMGYLKHKQLV